MRHLSNERLREIDIGLGMPPDTEEKSLLALECINSRARIEKLENEVKQLRDNFNELARRHNDNVSALKQMWRDNIKEESDD